MPRRYETNVIVSDTNDDDPASFKEAKISPDKEKWQEALNQEIESMDSNSVWTLINPLEGVRIIRCKWIYKKKKEADREVETYKARMVAKDYTQREEIDY